MKRTFRRFIILNWVGAIAAMIVSLATRKYLRAKLTHYQEGRPTAWCHSLRLGCVLHRRRSSHSLRDRLDWLFLFRKWAKSADGEPVKPAKKEVCRTHLRIIYSAVTSLLMAGVSILFNNFSASLFDSGWMRTFRNETALWSPWSRSGPGPSGR